MKAKVCGLIALSAVMGSLAPAVALYPGWWSVSTLAVSAVGVVLLAGLVLGEVEELAKGGEDER